MLCNHTVFQKPVPWPKSYVPVALGFKSEIKSAFTVTVLFSSVPKVTSQFAWRVLLKPTTLPNVEIPVTFRLPILALPSIIIFSKVER